MGAILYKAVMEGPVLRRRNLNRELKKLRSCFVSISSFQFGLWSLVTAAIIFSPEERS